MGQQSAPASHASSNNTTIIASTTSSENVSKGDKEVSVEFIDFGCLPEELVEQVLFFLDCKSLLQLRVTCKLFGEKIQCKKMLESTRQLIPRNDNQNELYFVGVLNLPDLTNVIGLHIKVLSHDQGWASVGGSYTWGEMSFLSDPSTSQELTERINIFTGKPATKQFEKYNKFIYKNQIKGFENLSTTPCIGIWARSCYGCWQIYMGGATISVVYLK